MPRPRDSNEHAPPVVAPQNYGATCCFRSSPTTKPYIAAHYRVNQFYRQYQKIFSRNRNTHRTLSTAPTSGGNGNRQHYLVQMSSTVVQNNLGIELLVRDRLINRLTSQVPFSRHLRRFTKIYSKDHLHRAKNVLSFLWPRIGRLKCPTETLDDVSSRNSSPASQRPFLLQQGNGFVVWFNHNPPRGEDEGRAGAYHPRSYQFARFRRARFHRPRSLQLRLLAGHSFR